MTGTTSSDLPELAAAAIEAAAGGEDVEAYAEQSRRTHVRARGGEIESLSFAESRGVGVRVLLEGRVGYAYAADPDRDEVAGLVLTARESAGFAEPDPANVLPDLEPVEPLPRIFSESQAAMDTDRKVALALQAERAAVGAHPEVRKVESASFGDAAGRVAVASTRGGPLEYARTDCWVSVVALAERDGETQIGGSYRLERQVGELEWEEAAREAAERAARLLGGVKPATERLPVVLDPVAAASFLGVLAGALSAESVLKGRSVLGSLAEQVIGAQSVSIVDDGRLEEGARVAPFDDEGVATARTVLVHRGVLRGFLHNTYTAARTGGRSTGNAGRGGYRAVPGVSASNLYLEPGSDTVEALLSRAGRAVYVQDVAGLHSGANPISGEFSVGASGLRIEHGALGGALREMTIASTLLDVLRGVVGVGSDLRFQGGLGAPTVLVGEMTVAGT